MARNVCRRIIVWGDGWLPNRVTPALVEDGRAQLDALAGEADRDPASISISVYGQEADLDLIRSFHDAGADRVVVRPNATDTEEAMARELERIADAVLR